jgi:hypothetical protein
MTMDPTTSRRNFLKCGAIAAAPLAIAMPAAAAADEESKAKLARLQDEKAIAELHREVVRQINRGERKLANGLTALADDPAHDLEIAFAGDGHSATCRRTCVANIRTEFTGGTTLERMHRLQGQGSHEHAEARVLVTEYIKGKDGWAIAGLSLA